MLACCRPPPARVLSASVSDTLTVLRLSDPFGVGQASPPRSACFAGRSVATHAAGDPDGSYRTLAAPHHVTVEVKKSKFITSAWPTSTPEEALQLVADASDPSASHNCFAYKIGEQFRSSDDGEPSGTAGPPILNAITGEGLNGVCVLVTRHFGGVKLGAGGLVRAYGGAARECLRAAECCTVLPQRRLRLQVPVQDIGIAYGQLDRVSAERLEEQYSDDGQMVALDVRVAVAQAANLQEALADASSGRIVLETTKSGL